MKSPTWTRPYCGVTHLGELASGHVTVSEYSGFATLSVFLPVGGLNYFSQPEFDFKTVADAKIAGEKWLSGNRDIKSNFP